MATSSDVDFLWRILRDMSLDWFSCRVSQEVIKVKVWLHNMLSLRLHFIDTNLCMYTPAVWCGELLERVCVYVCVVKSSG